MAATFHIPALFEDQAFLILGKPAGVHLEVDEFEQWNSLVKRSMGTKVGGGPGGTGLTSVVRLAPNESGLVVFAKTPSVNRSWASLLREGGVSSVHDVLIEGTLDPKRLSRERKPDTRPSKQDRPRAKTSRRSPVSLVSGATLRSVARSEQHQLLEVSTVLSSKHDLRAAFRYFGTPIVGDYRGSRETGTRYAGRCYLHLRSLSFRHPLTRQAMAITYPTPAAFRRRVEGDDGLEDALTVAWRVRYPLSLQQEIDAFRLINGDSDGVRGLTAEKLGSIVVLWTQPGRFDESQGALKRIAAWCRSTLGSDAVYRKVAAKSSRSGEEVRDETQCIAGHPVGEEIEVVENGLKYGIRPCAGQMTGLFLDQRDNRQRLRDGAIDQRVLNLFAYTCSFSVAAAAGGASETVSVDLSAGALEWGRRNFERNALAGPNHEFFRSEVFEFLKLTAKKRRIFDIIVLDPPTFARSKKPKRIFQFEKDIDALIRECLKVLAPRGRMLISTNSRNVSHAFLRSAVHQAADDGKLRIIMTPELPLDHASDPHQSKSLWVKRKA